MNRQPRHVWLLVAVLCFASGADACGMTTHTEIAHRSEGWFDDAQISSLLHDNVDAFEAGAPFPDWGYSCTYDGHHFSNESEAAHWGLFLNNFTQHILQTYGAPDKWALSAHARSVAAFLFGLRSHQVADVVWHWGPDGAGDLQGFLRSESHFSSTCKDSWNTAPDPTCHIIGDVGGDLVLGALKLSGNVRTWTWAVPVDDVVAVYRRMGSAFHFVTPDAITHCVKLLYAGRAAVWSVGDAAVPHFSSHAAFLEQELQEFVYGGLEDMAMQTADAWRELSQVLRGEEPMPPPFQPPSQLALSPLSQSTAVPPSLAPSWWVQAAANPQGLSLVSAASNASHVQQASILPPIIAQALIDSRDIYLEMLNVIESEHGFIHLDETGPKKVWGSGATFREQMGLGISSGKTIVAAVSTRSLVLWDVQGNFLSQHPLGGRSVVVAEATGDEHEDVLVATRNGSIILLDGRTMQSSVILQSNERAFATRIDVGDCDGDGRPDVLISSPQMASGGYQRGAASVYVASSAGINWQKPTWHAEGIQNSQWFGRGLACDAGHVIVGSPGWRAGGNSSFEGVGMIQMFQLDSRDAVSNATVEGDAPQQQFGFSVAISGSLVLVGSPGHSPNALTFTGKLDAFDFPLVNQPALWSIVGDQPFARFGMTIAAAPSSDGPSVVAVGQPHRKTAVDGGNHGGAVTLLVGHRDRSRVLHAPQSDMKFDCKTSACVLGGIMRFVNASYILFGVPLVSEFGSVVGLSFSV